MSTSISSKWGFDIADLVSAARPAVSADDRPRAIDTLAGVILDRERRWDYLKDVRRLSGARFRRLGMLSDKTVARAITGGLGALTNEELGEMALNPVAIQQLVDELDVESEDLEELAARWGEAWWDAMAAAGESLMREHGLRMPDLSDLEARACDAPVGAAAMLGQGAETADGVPQIRQRFEISAAQCRWLEGQAPTDARPAIIEIGSDETGVTVAVGGFLRVGPEVALTVNWYASDGTLLASGSPDNPFVAAAILPAPENRVLGSGDRVEVLHHYRPADGPGWVVGVDVPIP